MERVVGMVVEGMEKEKELWMEEVRVRQEIEMGSNEEGDGGEDVEVGV